MKKMIWSLAIVILMTGMVCFSAGSAQASGLETYFSATTGSQDFTLVNKTGVEIYALYVTPHSAAEWGDDVLGIDTLAANETCDITFSWKTKAKYWDLRVEDEGGAYIEWDKLNLIEISTVTLYYKNGKATAIID